MREIRRFLAVVLAICLMAGLLPGVSAAATQGVTAEQLQQAHAQNASAHLTSAMAEQGWTTVDGVLIPPEIASSEMFKAGRVPIVVTVGARSVAQFARERQKTIGDLTVSERQTAQSMVDSVQQTVVNQVAGRGVGMQGVKQYGLLVAGFSATVMVNDLKTLAAVVGTNNIHVQRMYTIGDTYSNAMIKADATWTDPGVNGTGAVVGVIDTGVDYTHPDFGGDGTYQGFPTSKIVAGYDFAGDNAAALDDYSLLGEDADPMDSNGHGTHVSGIVAADGTIAGVAPKAHIVIAKIVPGNAGSAYTSSIVAAFEYMADPTNTYDVGPEGTHPPVTAINMSFGSASGFVNPSDPENIAIEACISNGILVSLSAGNSGAGDATYPDFATIGSPSITPGSVSVASVENERGQYWQLTEMSQPADYLYVETGPTHPKTLGDNGGSGYQYVYCGLGGSASSFPSPFPTNTIALIQRGTYNFTDKIRNAAVAGAAAVIVFNSAAGGEGLINMAYPEPPDYPLTTIPAMFVQRSTGLALAEKSTDWTGYSAGDGTGRIAFLNRSIIIPNAAALAMSDFSSWGPAPDLSFKPDLTAPGGNIWSTTPVAMGSYANFSGTSMAAPHVAGAAALVRLANPSWTVAQTKLALSNTVTLLADPNSSDGSYYSPRLVGAGLINVQNAAKSSVLVKRTGFETASVALGSIEDWNTNPITFGLTLENFGSGTVTYAATGTVQWTDRSSLAAHAISGATITMSPSTVTIPAGQTRNVTVTVNATGVTPSAAYHPFVEGFVTFAATSGSTIDLHVPYMGFLGNWNDFNQGDAQFNPIVEAPVAGVSETWLYNLDFYENGGLGGYPPGYLLPMGRTLTGSSSADAVAIHPGSTRLTTYEGYYYLGTYGVKVGLNILRNLDHLTITVENSSGTVVKHITDIGLDTLEQMGKGLWIGYNVDWDWTGTDDASAVVPDGQYYVVARMTPQKVVNKLTADADQVIRMPITVDTVDPVVTITSIVPATTTQTVSWTTTDAAPSSGIFGYELYWSTDGWGTPHVAYLPPTATSYSSVPRGAEVDLYVVDYAGNWDNDYATPQDIVITSTLPETVLIGTRTDFSITARNWGVEDFNPVRLDGTIAAPASWQPANMLLEYYETADTSWHALPLTGSNGSFAFFIPPHAGFDLTAGASIVTQLRITVAALSVPGLVTLNVSLNKLDGLEVPLLTGNPIATLTDSTYAVTAPLDITSAPSPLSAGFTNTAYVGATFTATGGVGAPYTFTATGLPSGMSVSSAGVLSGTPAATGDFTLHVTVANAGGALTYTEDFALHINLGPGVTMTWQPLAGGTVTGPAVPPEDSTGSYVIQANAGYVIGTVLWNSVNQTVPAGAVYLNCVFYHITGSNTLAVTFDPIVTVTAGPNGTVTPGTGSVTYHSNPSYRVQPDPGYLIDTLVLDGTAITAAANTLSYTVTLPYIEVPHAIVATFKPIPDVLAPTITFPKYGGVAGVTDWVDGVIQTFTVHSSPFPLQFTVEDNSGSVKWTIKVNGRVVVDPMGSGLITYMLALSEGRNDVEVTGTDGAGNWTSQKLVIYLDGTAPVLSINPVPPSVSTGVLTITGSVIDAVSGLASLTINGEPITPFLDGSFSQKVTLTKGDNSIVVEAKDNAGNATSQTFTVKYGTTSSVAPSSLYVVLTIGSANMEVNGMSHKMDAAPFIKDGRTLLPIRALIEALGGSVQWNASTKTATVTLGSRTVALTIGSKTALVNGSRISLDVAPMIVKGRTFLPLRAVAENIGLDLAWEPVSRTISLTYWP